MIYNANIYVYTSLSCNVYTSSSLDIIDYSRHVLDLGIYVSSDCSFEFHITIVFWLAVFTLINY